MRHRADLVGQLREQQGFLSASAAAFDAGSEAEAKRLAVTVRVLVRETRSSRALLAQLGVMNRIQWPDGAFPPVDDWRPIAAECSLASLAGDRYAPVFDLVDLATTKRRSFRDWWSRAIACDPGAGESSSRKDLVLALANKDGGAHIDPRELPAAYHRLSRTNFEGWEVVEFDGAPSDPGFVDAPGRPVGGSVAAAAMRQVAQEVLVGLDEAWRLLDEAPP